MPVLFVSHSSHDLGNATRIVQQLRDQNFTSLFVDFDPKVGIPGGRSWEKELYAQLRRADGVLFLASEASVASTWCVVELSLARSLGRPIFPLRIEPHAGLRLLDDVQWIDYTPEQETFTRLWAALHAAGLNPDDSFAFDPQRSPYPGLEPFSRMDAATFFGRDRETERLQELFQSALRRHAGRFVAVVGPSGSGKSSLMSAGLLPRLQRLPHRWLLLHTMHPGSQPIAELANSLAQTFADLRHERSPETLLGVLNQSGSAGLTDLVRQLARAAQAPDSTPPSVLVVIDQAEELLTRSGPDNQRKFLDLVCGALGDDSPLWVVATLRSEFLSGAPDRAGLAEAVDDSLVVEPLSRAHLPEVIELPGRRAGVEFDPGLVERMASETSGGDALPLMAFTLRELYQRMGQDRRITIAAYEAVGGVVGSLRASADRLLADLERRGRGDAVIPTLLKLATVQGIQEPTRRVVRWNTLTSVERAIMEAFIDGRLLTSKSGGSQDVTVEVAHEALLRQWPPLRDAINTDRARLQMRSELERLAVDWETSGRNESFLLRGDRLVSFLDWSHKNANEQTQSEKDYLQSSRDMATRELDRTRQSNRRLRGLAGALALLLVVTLLAGSTAIVQRARAVTERTQARSAEIAQAAASQPPELVDRAMVFAVASERLSGSTSPQTSTKAGLLSALASNPRVLREVDVGSEIDAFAATNDGAFVAAGSVDGKVTIIDSSTGRVKRQIELPGGEVRSVAFSPDGTLLAVGASDASATIWGVNDGRLEVPAVGGHASSVRAVTFSPDGLTLATGDGEGRIVLHRIDGSAADRVLLGHRDWVNTLAFSNDGKTLFSGSGQPQLKSVDSRILAWPVEQPGPAREIGAHTQAVRDLALSPDATKMASVGDDALVRIWDLTTGTEIMQLEGTDARVFGVTYSPDGQQILTAGRDRMVRIWDITTGSQAGEPLRGHELATHDVVSLSASVAASAGSDGRVVFWDISANPLSRLVTRMSGPDDGLRLTATRDGTRIASSGTGETVVLRDGRTGAVDSQPLQVAANVTSLNFSPDGHELVLATRLGLEVWDTTSRTLIAGPVNPGPVRSLTVGTDGTIAAGLEDGSIRLWRTGLTGEPISLVGHNSWVTGVAFTPSMDLVSAGADGELLAWSLDGDQHRRLATGGEVMQFYSLASSPDDNIVVAGDTDGRIHLIQVPADPNAQLTEQITSGQGETITALGFSHDGQSVVSGDAQGSVALWAVQSSALQAVGPPRPIRIDRPSGVFSVAFTDSSRKLVTGASSGSLLWDNDNDEWLRELCKVAGRDISDLEREMYSPDLDNMQVCSNGP